MINHVWMPNDRKFLAPKRGADLKRRRAGRLAILANMRQIAPVLIVRRLAPPVEYLAGNLKMRPHVARMRAKIIFLFLSMLLVVPAAAAVAAASAPGKPVRPDQQEMFETLRIWCNGLLAWQITGTEPDRDGGLLCPGCDFIHGRCADAIYPLLYLADQTGSTRYIDAAKRLFKWSSANVRCDDGAWRNEINPKSWKGVSVFTAIMLMETLHDFGRLLDPETKREWTEAALGQLPFIVQNFKVGYGNVNYPASACYAFMLAAQLTGDNQYKKRAAQLAAGVSKQFTDNESLVYGEGKYPYEKSAKGLLPVDLGYNVEETLPNLLAYAEMAGDKKLRARIVRSFRSHLEFMLADGAWDNSWGTRNFKWTYWGSRTSDGIFAMCAALAKDDPVFVEAGWRNFELLKSCTREGLLCGGVDYATAGCAPCIHHTFERAKCLAHALHNGFGEPAAAARVLLPREENYRAKHIKDLDTWLVTAGDWRGTITGYDVDYRLPDGNAHGGTLSLLWHKDIGPVFAAAMIDYSLVEPNNMQPLKSPHAHSTVPRIVYVENGATYSTAFCKTAVITHTRDKQSLAEIFTVETELVDKAWKSPDSGRMPFTITYVFDAKRISIKASAGRTPAAGKYTLELPVISNSGETCARIELGYRIEKTVGNLLIVSGKSQFEIQPLGGAKRAFCPVPGFEFVPFHASFDREVAADIFVKQKPQGSVAGIFE